MSLSLSSILSAVFKRSVRHPVPDLAFMVLALTAASWGMGKTIRGYPSEPATWACLFGVTLAWWAAGKPKWRALLATAVFLVGIFMFFIQAGALMDTLWLSFYSAIKLGFALAQNFIVQTFWESPPPPINITVPTDWIDLSSGLSLVWGRFSNWLGLFLQNRPFYDQAAVIIWWSTAAWIFAWWAGIILRKRNSALLATAPAGILLAALLNRSSGDARLLLPFTGAVLALHASNNYFQAREGWLRKRLDLPDTLGLDTSIWAGAVVAVAIVLGFTATTLPALNIQTLREFTDSLRQAGPAGKPEEDALGVQPANRVPTPPPRIGIASLPRQHLIGASPELSEQLALYYEILSDSSASDGLPLIQPYYLRGLVYDVYLQAGWASSSVSTRQFEPGETIQSIDSTESNRRQMEQLITLAPTNRGMVLVAGDAVAINQPVEATWRAAPSGIADIFGLGVAEAEYLAWSSQAEASAEELRRASQDYPTWIRQRYLQLPDNIPTRVVSLAANFTHIPTAYDTATAIESHLRSYTYTLDIPQPPIGQDIVDYFLFDLKQGYCDYYASAMVVLARLNGLPARLAIGYVASDFDPINQRYVVKEKSAHSWAEVYFPGYGWIPFEPTAGLSRLSRSGIPSIRPNLADPTPSPPGWLRGTQISWKDWGLFVIGLALLALLIAVQLIPVVERWWVGRDGPILAITRLYRRFERLAVRLTGLQPAGTTPLETAHCLSAHLYAARWPVRRASTYVRAAGAEITDLYIQAAYTPSPPTGSDVQRAWQLWRQLKQNSRLLLLLKRGKPSSKHYSQSKELTKTRT